MADIEIDTDHRLTAVTRLVEPADRDGETFKAVIASEVYPSPPADVWDALTDPERLSRWFLPVTGDLRLGGTYQLEGNAGGEVLECEPEERFVVTWVYDGNVSWVEVTLEADGDGTRMRLAHTCHADNPFWDQFGPGATGVGWELGMLGLSLHLRDGDAVDREAVEGWTMGAEGLRLARGSAAAWGEVDAAGGEDPEVARRRADEVGTFYTTPPPEAGAAEGEPG
jgi:uncharacterized protein YndB with AHSA1/START domain